MRNDQFHILVSLALMLLSCDKMDDTRSPTTSTEPIGAFTSIKPQSQITDFIIPDSHIFQKIIESGDPLTKGGDMPINNDFTGYVPIDGSSTEGYLSINSENFPGAVTILDIRLNPISQLWEVTSSEAVNFDQVGGTTNNCSGTVTPWNTIISCEERIQAVDANMDGYNDYGWAVEIDPATKTVLDKRWAMGNFAHENATVHSNLRTVYQGADSNPGYLYKFVADNERDLDQGNLYVYVGKKEGQGGWARINNSTVEERNATLQQSQDLGGTIFNGIEDVEIGPDGMIYFAVKGEDRVYRFTDEDYINSGTVTMETFVGNMEYLIDHGEGETVVSWGTGNDNLAFDDQGNLWVLQDGGLNYIWVVEKGHTQENPKVKLFGTAPMGSEPTGITFTPDYKYLFISIQKPDPSNDSTSQLDAAGTNITFNNNISLVVGRKDYLGNN